MSKWIEFTKQQKPESRKTDIYFINAKDGGFFLGTISWYSPWRKYCFYPSEGTVFETQCLQDITDFIKNLMEERKKNVS